MARAGPWARLREPGAAACSISSRGAGPGDDRGRGWLASLKLVRRGTGRCAGGPAVSEHALVPGQDPVVLPDRRPTSGPGQAAQGGEGPAFDGGGVSAPGGPGPVHSRPVHPPVVVRVRRVIRPPRIVRQGQFVAHVDERDAAEREHHRVHGLQPPQGQGQPGLVPGRRRALDPAERGGHARDPGVPGDQVLLEQRPAGERPGEPAAEELAEEPAVLEPPLDLKPG